MISLNQDRQTVVNSIISKITNLNSTLNPMNVELTDAQINSVTYDLSSLVDSLIRDGIMDNITTAINDNSYSLGLNSYKFVNYADNAIAIFAVVKNSRIEPIVTDIDIMKINIDVTYTTSSIAVNKYAVYANITPIVDEIQLITQ